ncbi:MAG: LysR family transcriptional regulator [Oligoflexales bacterium]
MPYFRTIVQEGSFQKAAKKIRIAQPSLTKSVKTLEEILGVSLLKRSHQGVSPTSEGKKLIAFADKMLAELQALEGEIDRNASRRLSIATHEILVQLFWCRLVRELDQTKDPVELALETMPSTTKMMTALIDGEFDVVVAVEVVSSPLVASKQIAVENYGFYASKEFVKTHKMTNPLTLDDLKAAPLFYSGNVIGGKNLTLQESLLQHGITQKSRYTLRSLESVDTIVRGGLGIGILPHWLVDASPNRSLVPMQIKAPGIDKLGEHRIFVCARKAGSGGILDEVFSAIQRCWAKP